MNKTDNEFDTFAKEYMEVLNQSIRFTGADSNYFSEFKVIRVKEEEVEINGKILDLGCGVGNSLFYFRKHFPKAELYGVDTSGDSIREAQKKKISDCFFYSYNGTTLPFGDNHFDIVFIACVLHHVERKFHINLLNEVWRILKKEGRLYIFEHNKLNPATQKVVHDCPFDKNVILLSQFYLKKIAHQAGYKNLKIKNVLFFPRILLFKPFLFLEKYLTWVPIGAQHYLRSVK